ncbi:tyrosine--tRNA ligase, partial [Streptococcus agalactiae]|nr:tyrosine--tRNA ligase [Streptococcus agalactiae]
NYMMSKESVKKRIETGISYTEFAYQIMQGYDFYELNKNYNVTLQIGGSDQWGNMTAGTELIRRKSNGVSHVMTVPLITDSTGKKFGKSEGNAVWLDADKTSPYEMYQFWLNVMDADAVRFLKIFTFLSLKEIEDIRIQFEEAPHLRLAQKTLAREVVTLVHGEKAYKEAVNITEQLFAGNIKELSVKELKQGLRGVPNYHVQTEDNLNIIDLLVTSGVVNSKRQAREDVSNGAIYINGDRIQDLEYTISENDKLENEITVIRRGKKKYFVLNFK